MTGNLKKTKITWHKKINSTKIKIKLGLHKQHQPNDLLHQHHTKI